MIIAIDGPSGAGKGTIARAVARALGIRHIDTGAMYRAVAWRALDRGLDLDDEEQMATLAAESVIDVDGSRVTIDGADVSSAIRTPEIDRATTRVARLSRVRAILVGRQRVMGEQESLVMEGRDIATVVFPGADVKVFLDASPEERARRRLNDPAHAARSQDLSEVARAMLVRDETDRTRASSPLAIASDAHVIDTTGVPIDEVVRRVLAIARRVAGTGQ
ncbi:MAG: (d)CMP kinase [Acidobacteriota bacterium]